MSAYSPLLYVIYPNTSLRLNCMEHLEKLFLRKFFDIGIMCYNIVPISIV